MTHGILNRAWLLIPLVGLIFSVLFPSIVGLMSNNLIAENRKIHMKLREHVRKSHNLLKYICDSQYTFYDETRDILGTTFFSKNAHSRQPYVANGYIGARLSTLGQGFAYDEINIHASSESLDPEDELLKNGWPLFNKRYTGAFAAGFYSLQEKLPDTNYPELYANGYDSVISALPYWPTLDIEYILENQTYIFNPQTVVQSEISNYVQNMSIENGIVSTKLTWLEAIDITVEVVAHKRVAPLGLMKIEINSLLDDDIEVKIIDQLKFETSQRCFLRNIGNDDDSEGIFIEVSPDNVDYSRAAIYSTWDLTSKGNATISKDVNEGEIFKSSIQTLKRNTPLVVHKYVGIITTEYLDNHRNHHKNELDFAKKIAITSKESGYDELISSHREAWKRQFQKTNIKIPSNALLTLSAKSTLYHLFANSRHDSKGLTSALSTPGLSSDSYGSMVFWDTDLWVIPALVPFAPENALAISEYRNYTHEQAKLNAKQYNYPGAVYPWTSGRFGNCTSTGPCIDYEYHVNIDVVLGSWFIYLASKDDDNDEYLRYTTWPLMKDAADFLTQYTQYDASIGKFVTKNLTDPDEYANHIDNGAFTNAGIDSLLKVTLMVANHLNEPINPKWVQVFNNIYIPRSDYNITLEYSNMNGSALIKQADVVLISFPLDFNDFHDSDQARRDLNWYSLRQADIGPAMTFPIYTVASAKLLNQGCSSQSFLLKSVLPYVRSPFSQFSEQADDNYFTNGGTHPAFPFLPGHGGFIQALVYGLLGIRYNARINSATLKIEKFLEFDPAVLTAFPGGIRINGISYLNQQLDILISDFEGIIFHKGYKPINIQVGKRNEKAGYYTIQPQTSFSVPLFKPLLNLENSVNECMPIANLTSGSPGDVALSAIDGNNYTYWQPFDKSIPSKLLIDLKYPQKISKGLIIWGSRPSDMFSIYFSTDISFTFDQAFENINRMNFFKVIDNQEVGVSEPFKESYLTDVKLQPQNITEFVMKEAVTTRFIIVEVLGTIDQDEDNGGGTIHEIAFF